MALTGSRDDQMQRARRAARVIGQMRPDAAVCLFGSLARGTDDAQIGDVDLLVVDPTSRIRPTAVLRQLQEPSAEDPPLNVVSFSSDGLDRMWNSGAPMAFHIAREARVLRDPLGIMDTHLAREPRHDFPGAARRELARLAPYRKPNRFNGNLTAGFAQVYRVGRTLVMLRLGQRGAWEFDRHAAFARLAEFEPERRHQIASIERLEPFEAWQRRRRSDIELPFSPFTDENPNAEALLAAAIVAAERLTTPVLA
jgi:hypothetical protein